MSDNISFSYWVDKTKNETEIYKSKKCINQ